MNTRRYQNDEEFIAAEGPKFKAFTEWWFQIVEWLFFTAVLQYLANKTEEIILAVLAGGSLGAISIYIYYVAMLKFDIRKALPQRFRKGYITLAIAVVCNLLLFWSLTRGVQWVVETVSKYEIG